MDSKKRVELTFNHIEPDRIPCFELAIDDEIGSKILNKDITLFFQSSKLRRNLFYMFKNNNEISEKYLIDRIIDTIDLYNKIGMDIIPLRFYSGLISVFIFSFMGLTDSFNKLKVTEKDKIWEIRDTENFWTKFKFEEKNNTINVVNDCINTKGINELKRFNKLAKKRIGNSLLNLPIQIKRVMKGVKFAIENNKEKYFLGYGNIPFPTNCSFLPLFLESMYLEPKIINEYLELTTEGVLPLIETQLKLGVDAIICTSDYCYNKGPIISPDHFKQFLVPQYRKIVELCHKYNKPFIKHLDGNINELLELLIYECGVDGIHAIEEKANMDIGELKKKYGSRITLLGNIDCSDLLSFGKYEEVVAKTKEIIRTVSPGGGHVASSSNSIHSGIDLKNFIAYLNTIKKYGSYPIKI